MTQEQKASWYPRLLPWKNWEIPVPGKQAVIGFLALFAVSVGLHLFVIWMCSVFRIG